ncbi:MAG TPA: C40 family peptidase [Candidatus Ligilactobacillus excrementavium]|nr:C40 family peptidase [Candidatus Ligilactobacillus excrementavium]
MAKNFLSKSALTLATITLMSVAAPSVSADTTSDLKNVNTEIATAKQKLTTAQDKIGSNTQLQLKQAQKISDLKQDISERSDQLQKQARSAQVNNSGSVVKFISDSESFSDAISRSITVATVVHANNRAMQQQRDDKAEVESQQTALNKSVKKQKDLQIQLMQSSANLDSKRAELTAKKNKEDQAAQKAAAEAKKAAKEASEAKTVAAATKAADTAKDSTADNEQNDSVKDDQAVSTQTVQLANNKTQTKTNASNNGSNNNNKQAIRVGHSSSQNNNRAPKKESYTPAPAASYGSVTSLAQSFVGKSPYKMGGTTPAGFDCSGFVQYVFGKQGKSLPRVTSAQENAGTKISVGQAQAGDLYFWGSRGSSYHVAIALGGGSYVHAPAPGQKVSTGSTHYYKPSFAVRVN